MLFVKFEIKTKIVVDRMDFLTRSAIREEKMREIMNFKHTVLQLQMIWTFKKNESIQNNKTMFRANTYREKAQSRPKKTWLEGIH